MIAAVFVLAMQAQTAPTYTPRRMTADEIDCQRMREVVAAAQGDLPMQTDAVTQTVGMSVMCGLRTYATNKALSVPSTSLREGWRSRKQKQWNDMICKNEAFEPMAKRGWRFTMNMTFRDGVREVFEAKCE